MSEKQEHTEVIYGRHPIEEALKAGRSFEKILLQEGTRGELEIFLRHTCKDHNIPLQVVPKERLSKWTRGNHQGVVGLMSAIQYQKLDDVLPLIYERGETPLLLLLDNVSDVRNFGAIARSAEAVGAHAIVVANRGAAMANADAMKTSAGALNFIPVCRETSLSVALDTILGNGIAVLAADLKGAEPLQEIDLTQPCAILMGAEGQGIHPSLLKRATQKFFIPMKGQTDSFNVSVAAGIALYEAIRQRGV